MNIEPLSARSAMRAVLACIAATALSAVGGSSQASEQKAPTLQVPDGQSILLIAHARGVQLYETKAKENDSNSFEWVFTGPQAELFDSAGKKIGTHGAGPKWTYDDGSSITATKIESVPGAKAADIPWLLLKAGSTTGTGLMNRVSYVMRVDTVGGAAPTGKPTVGGTRTAVAYTATYVFFETAKARN